MPTKLPALSTGRCNLPETKNQDVKYGMDLLLHLSE